MFKQAFKRYKNKTTSDDLQEVVDFDHYEATEPHSGIHNLQLVKPATISEFKFNLSPLVPVGLQSPNEWRSYKLINHPGLLIIRNPFTPTGQRYWIARCLRDYPRTPNRVNLDAKHFSVAAISDWWRELHQVSHTSHQRLKNAMRWTTLGFHHNWDTKVYDEGKQSGMTLDDPPTALYLRSGDVLIMSKESRLCYHAVPRVFKTLEEPWNKLCTQAKKMYEDPLDTTINLELNDQVKDDSFWIPFDNYVKNSRININVRQVMPSDVFKCY